MGFGDELMFLRDGARFCDTALPGKKKFFFSTVVISDSLLALTEFDKSFQARLSFIKACAFSSLYLNEVSYYFVLNRHLKNLNLLPNYPGNRPYIKKANWFKFRWSDKRFYFTDIHLSKSFIGNFSWSPSELVENRDLLSRYSRYVLIEPDVKGTTSAYNKSWGVEKYIELASKLKDEGIPVLEIGTSSNHKRIPCSEYYVTPTFRSAMQVVSSVKLYVGPEGGLHHAAGSLNKDAVVLFGGYISPVITGYDHHVNLFIPRHEGDLGCGSLRPCSHCKNVLEHITIPEVLSLVLSKYK